jgi:hypothetical protein
MIEQQVHATKIEAAREALPQAEAAAKSALVEHVQGVRSAWIKRARRRIDQAAAKLTEAAGAHVLELAQAVAAHHYSQAPVAPELLQLES